MTNLHVSQKVKRSCTVITEESKHIVDLGTRADPVRQHFCEIFNAQDPVAH